MENKAIELLEMVQEVNGYNGALEYLEFFDMECFNELMCGSYPDELARRIFHGDFNPNHEYFEFNGYGNLVSLSDYELERELLDYEEEIRSTYKELFE